MTLVLTGDQIITEMRRLAKENPGYVYGNEYSDQGCLYYDAKKNCGACLVGQALFNLGANVRVLDESMYTPSFKSLARNWNELSAEHDVNFDFTQLTDRQINWISDAQGNQDTGSTWENALIGADHWYPLDPMAEV